MMNPVWLESQDISPRRTLRNTKKKKRRKKRKKEKKKKRKKEKKKSQFLCVEKIIQY